VPGENPLNSHDVLHPEQDPSGAQTASVREALRLGCVAVGYTIYTGTAERRLQYEQLRELKVKLPTTHLELEEARKVYEAQHIPRDTLTERVRNVLQSTFNGRRIVIFSGGAKTDDAAILDQVRTIRAGGGFGSIIGRNSFQRDRSAALSLLDHVIRIYKGETP